ncbi:outer membrane lipoprotein carrier protein LolA [Candidatus Poribacteria bacterium]|nr:outer membrane lipoprotein carrier protein LolA [Candidatus Poribacteria bacterium]
MFRLYLNSLIFLSCLLIIPNCYALTVEEIFANFQSAYKKSENFSATFEETTLYKDRKTVTYGRFVFSKPNLLRKEYISKNDNKKITKTIVIDGLYAWSHVPLLNQVNKMQWNDPSRRELLPGAGASLEDISKNYTMKLVPDEDVNPKGIYLIQLLPKRLIPGENENLVVDTSNKEVIEIWLKKSDWLPVQFGYINEFDDGSRRSVVFKMTNIERDKNLPTNIFKFEIPKNAEVIDLSN